MQTLCEGRHYSIFPLWQGIAHYVKTALTGQWSRHRRYIGAGLVFTRGKELF